MFLRREYPQAGNLRGEFVNRDEACLHWTLCLPYPMKPLVKKTHLGSLLLPQSLWKGGWEWKGGAVLRQRMLQDSGQGQWTAFLGEKHP